MFCPREFFKPENVLTEMEAFNRSPPFHEGQNFFVKHNGIYINILSFGLRKMF
jgi:hypothetical protein